MPGCFEGWYFKLQSDRDMIAFIPAGHTERGGGRTGSLQLVTADRSFFIGLPSPPVREPGPLSVKAGGCVFSLNGLELNIRRPGITVTGRLRFGPAATPEGDIMGPFRFVPFMECRHSVFSLCHTVSGGLTVNGRTADFTGGAGYIEGDRGRSFPKRYVWTQCLWRGGGAPCSLMLSAADVRPLGLPFMGIIGFVYFNGMEYRLATYRGAKLEAAENGLVRVRQGRLTLSAELLDKDAREQKQNLRAPVSGGMERLIRESLRCRARYRFTDGGTALFDFTTDAASFEYEL